VVEMNVHLKRVLLGVGVILVIYYPLRVVSEDASVISALLGIGTAMILGPFVFKDEKDH